MHYSSPNSQYIKKKENGGKILSQKHVKTSFYNHFSIHWNSRWGLRSKGNLGCFQIICGVKYLNKEGMTSPIQKVLNLSRVI